MDLVDQKNRSIGNTGFKMLQYWKVCLKIGESIYPLQPISYPNHSFSPSSKINVNMSLKQF